MMLQCQECGAIFAEARLCVEYWGECHGRPIYTPVACCTVCGGTLFVETEETDSEKANG